MSAGLLIPPMYPGVALDGDGRPVPGARLTTYQNGAPNTLKPVYADAALSIPLANPVIADANGVWPAMYAAVSSLFTVSAADALGAPLNGGAYDNVPVTTDATTGASAIATAAAQKALTYAASATRKVIVPDDYQLPSQSDTYGILKARDALVTLGGGEISFLPRVYTCTALDFSDTDNIMLSGWGAGAYQRDATTLRYTGAAGGVLVNVNNTGAHTGFGLRGLGLDGNGLALSTLVTLGIVGSDILNLNIRGATGQNWYLSANSFGNSQGLRVRGVSINAVPIAGSTALYIGPGTANWDTAQSIFEDIQCQAGTTGFALDIGAADTLLFRLLKAYRLNSDYSIASFTPGNLAHIAMRCRGGTAAGAFTNWCQSNRFLELEVVGGWIQVQGTETAGVIRPAVQNDFGIVNQSGGSYPTFGTGAATGSTVTNELGQLQLFDAAGLSYGVDATGKVFTPRLANYANDAAAATGGVSVGQQYRNGSVVQVRVS